MATINSGVLTVAQPVGQQTAQAPRQMATLRPRTMYVNQEALANASANHRTADQVAGLQRDSSASTSANHRTADQVAGLQRDVDALESQLGEYAKDDEIASMLGDVRDYLDSSLAKAAGADSLREKSAAKAMGELSKFMERINVHIPGAAELAQFLNAALRDQRVNPAEIAGIISKLGVATYGEIERAIEADATAFSRLDGMGAQVSGLRDLMLRTASKHASQIANLTHVAKREGFIDAGSMAENFANGVIYIGKYRVNIGELLRHEAVNRTRRLYKPNAVPTLQQIFTGQGAEEFKHDKLTILDPADIDTFGDYGDYLKDVADAFYSAYQEDNDVKVFFPSLGVDTYIIQTGSIGNTDAPINFTNNAAPFRWVYTWTIGAEVNVVATPVFTVVDPTATLQDSVPAPISWAADPGVELVGDDLAIGTVSTIDFNGGPGGTNIVRFGETFTLNPPGAGSFTFYIVVEGALSPQLRHTSVTDLVEGQKDPSADDIADAIAVAVAGDLDTLAVLLNIAGYVPVTDYDSLEDAVDAITLAAPALPAGTFDALSGQAASFITSTELVSALSYRGLLMALGTDVAASAKKWWATAATGLPETLASLVGYDDGPDWAFLAKKLV